MGGVRAYDRSTYFDGTDDALWFDHATSPLGTPTEVSFYVLTRPLTVDSSEDIPFIYRNDSGGVEFTLTQYTDSQFNGALKYATSGWSYVAAAETVEVGKWYGITWSWQRNRAIDGEKITLNGNTYKQASLDEAMEVTGGGRETTIGAADISSTDNDFLYGSGYHGNIAVVVVWEKYLTDKQHQQLSNGVHPLEIEPQYIRLYIPLDSNRFTELIQNEKWTVNGAPGLGMAPPAHLASKPRTLLVPTFPYVPQDAPAATNIVITDVNTTESWDDGDTGLVITGSGFM